MDAQACLRLLLFACNKVGFSSDKAHFILDVFYAQIYKYFKHKIVIIFLLIRLHI